MVVDLADVSTGDLITATRQNDLNATFGYVSSPMITTGGAITEGTNAGTFKVAALTAFFRITDSVTGKLLEVSLAEQDNQSITAADTTYYINLNYNSGSPTISLSETCPYTADKRNFCIGYVMKDGSNNVHYISSGYRLQDGVYKLHTRGRELRTFELAIGNTIAYSGTNNFTMDEGVIYSGINRITQSAYNSASTQFIPVYGDGGSGFTEGAASNVIDYAHYDDGDGTLGNVGVGKYGAYWVYRHGDDGDVYVVYGTGSYKLAEAESSLEPSKPDHLTDFGILVGRIIAPQAGGSFTSIQMVTDTFFTGTSVGDHGELGGLDGNDHTQYILHSLANAENDFLVASGNDTFVKQTLAATGAILEGDMIHDNLQGVTANEHLDWTGDLGATNIHAGNYTDNDTTAHASFSQLDYASASHTGFEPAKGADDNFVTDAQLVNIGNLDTAAYEPTATFASALGADDNYVTDNEKTVIGNTSGANTGDVSTATILAVAYPVGAVYISTLATNPNTLMGFGTWAVFGAGKVLVSLNSGDGDFDTSEETGGSKTAGLSVANLPIHHHTYGSVTTMATTADPIGAGIGVVGTGTSDTSNTGSATAHVNVQPYIVVYMWKRTA